ncbi:MAG: ATP-binding protein [Oscillospiraceae bacterium]|nr:ATP-binding protein [Oscillospiraceae bacterium]
MDMSGDFLKRRAEYTEALHRSIGIFLSESGEDLDAVMSNGLRPVAVAAELDRIIVYKLIDTDCGKRFSQVCRWVKTEDGTAALDEELIILPNDPAIEKWIETMSKGGFVNIQTCNMTAGEKVFLSTYGVLSMLLAPVFANGELWGAIAFQDHTNERTFDDITIELLSSSAIVCADAYIRAEKTAIADKAAADLKRGKEHTDTLNMVAELLIAQSGDSIEDAMTEGIKMIADLIDADRFSIFRNFPGGDGLHSSQIYRWDRMSGGTTEPNSAFSDVRYVKIMPTWEQIFIENKTVNSPVRLLPETEAAVFFASGAVSVFAAPVYIKDVFWGCAIFEDHENERVFDDDLVKMMRSAAYLCANTLIRAEMEREITAEKNLARDMVNAAPTGLIVWDKDLNILDCSDAITEIFGVSKQYFIDRFNEFSPEYQADGALSHEKKDVMLKRALEGEDVVFEWMHRSFSGEFIPCEVMMTRVVYNNEFLLLIYIYDLREIKKMEKEVAAAEHTQLMIDATPLGCILADEGSGIVTCNKSAVELFKAAAKEELIDSFYSLGPEYQQDGSLTREVIEKAIGKAFGEGYSSVEVTLRDTAGEFIPCEVTTVRVEYKGGYVAAVYIRDLRKLNELLKEIHDEKERFTHAAHWYESLLDAMPFVVTAQDMNEKFTFINAAAEDIFEKNKHDVIGMPCNLLGLNICKTENCAIACAKRGRMRTYFTHEDSSYQADVKIIKGLSGEDIGYIEIIQNITKTERISRQQAEAEAAGNAKSSFLSAMSHEIRTPLNAIIGMTNFARGTDDSEKKEEFLRKADTAARHLLRMVDEMLSIIDIEDGRFELARRDFSFSALLDRVTAGIWFHADEKRQTLYADIDPNIPDMLRGDGERLAKPLDIILDNAVKFTPENGDIRFSIRLIGEENETVTLQIEVADNGVGISDEKKEVIFNLFEQADAGIDRKYGGTGLGLALAKRLIELMGGEIRVESELGKGAKFIWTVKIETVNKKEDRRFDTEGPSDANDTEMPVERPLPVEIRNNASRSAMTVTFIAPDADALIVDDISTNLSVAEGLLQPYKIRVDTRKSGHEAIEVVMTKRYDIIFMDHWMPEMNGVETTRRIRTLDENDPYFKNVPIIALTANAVPGAREIFLQNGFNDYLPKPVDMNALNGILEKWLPEGKRTAVDTETGPDDRSGLADDIDIEIEGVVVNTGVLRSGGSIELYLRTLAAFYEDGTEKYDEIKRCLKDGDISLYASYVHAMKSAAANIGAERLSEAARKLEAAAIRGDATRIETDTEMFLDDLDFLLGNIRVVLSQKKRTREHRDDDTDDNGRFAAGLRELREALEILDAGAIHDNIENLRELALTDDDDAVVNNIALKVLMAEYDEAEALLDSLIPRE